MYCLSAIAWRAALWSSTYNLLYSDKMKLAPIVRMVKFCIYIMYLFVITLPPFELCFFLVDELIYYSKCFMKYMMKGRPFPVVSFPTIWIPHFLTKWNWNRLEIMPWIATRVTSSNGIGTEIWRNVYSPECLTSCPERLWWVSLPVVDQQCSRMDKVNTFSL